MRGRMSKVAAIILNYNSAKDTINCARLLMQQNEKPTIIVIDNNSQSDDIEEVKKELGNEIILIENKNNAGYSAGNNIGMKRAIEEGCQYALITNPDVEIRDRETVKKAVEALEKDFNIAMLGPDVIDIDGIHQNPRRDLNFFEDVFWPISLLLFKIKKQNRYVVNFEASGYYHEVVGCCFFVNLERMQDIDFYDENVFLYSEEPIISARIKQAGFKVYYLKDIQVKHNHIEEEKKDKKKRIDIFMDSRKYYIENYKYKGLKKKIVAGAIELERKYYSRKKDK